MFKKEDQLTEREMIAGVKMGTMVHGEKTLMARFTLTGGSVIPAHEHPHEQTGLLVSGRIVLTIDGVDHNVAPGDSWCIGSDVPHAAKALEDSVAVEVFSPVREDYLD
ncbi:cupin domain-containing protein [uncultured Desulfosarcina sp.]|uniref:cupin domain-containing protein n=1 Tax=uncultured Desulfosarcina sp. TaxID=218289 RepID=UPI0029C63D2F|nr:cupin domain-containing protein [uncultured Desulfosarcina sp.]